MARNVYDERSKVYVRLHGDFSYGDGGELHDILNLYSKYGLVPEEVYTGLTYGNKFNDFSEMQEGLTGFLKGVIKQNKLTPNWHKAFSAVLDGYFGEVPSKFTYKGKSYTPQSFAKENVGINPDDYVEFVCYEDAPKHEHVVAATQDNWSFSKAYNVTLDEFVSTIDNALKNGYTVMWGGDVSEKFFSWRNGIAYFPEKAYEDMTDDERKSIFDNPPAREGKVTPEMRQREADTWGTTEDHAMHLVGLAKDQNGLEYYIVKNSWGDKNDQKGYLYMSKGYLAYKTTMLIVHKNGVPANILKGYYSSK